MFFQFYDILFLTVFIISVYLSARKGFSKVFVIIIGYALSIFIASASSGTVATVFYSKFIQKDNIAEIEENLYKLDFGYQYKLYTENLGYNIRVDKSKLDEIFESGEDITEKAYQYFNTQDAKINDKNKFITEFQRGYVEIISDTVENVYKSDFENYEISSEMFDESIKMMYNKNDNLKALYIEENFIREPEISLIKTASAVIIITFIMIFVKIISDKIKIIKSFGIIDNILGAVLGVAEAFIILLIISAAVKFFVNIGNDEMILFNSETIEKTRLFRYIYKI